MSEFEPWMAVPERFPAMSYVLQRDVELRHAVRRMLRALEGRELAHHRWGFNGGDVAERREYLLWFTAWQATFDKYRKQVEELIA